MPYVTELPSGYISAQPDGTLSLTGSPALSELIGNSIPVSDYKIDADGQTSLSNGDTFTMSSPNLAGISATYLGAGTLTFAPVSGVLGPLTYHIIPQPISGSLVLSDGKYYIVTGQPFDDSNVIISTTCTVATEPSAMQGMMTGPASALTDTLILHVNIFDFTNTAEVTELLQQQDATLMSRIHDATTSLQHDPSIDHELTEDEVVCFVAGTLIDTERGPIAIEDLAPGDLIWTKDDGFLPLRWIGNVTLTAAVLARSPHLRPIRIRASALAPNIPSRDLLVSPQHRILVRSKIAVKMFGTMEVLIPAKQLLQVEGIDYADDQNEVTYYHMLFDRHQIVGSNGAETESLYTGPQALRSLSPAAREEIFTLFPELQAHDYSPESVRPLPSGRQSRKLAQRHATKGRDLIC